MDKGDTNARKYIFSMKGMSKMAILIQDRDEELLMKLNKYGSIYSRDVYEIYKSKFADEGSKDTFKYRRLKMLISENYISKKDGTFYLAANGRKYLAEKNEPMGYKYVHARQRIALADIYNIAKRLEGFKDIITRSDLSMSEEFGDDKSGYIVRYLFKVIANDESEYFVYKLKARIPIYSIKSILADMQRLGNSKVIIIYESKDTYLKYTRYTPGRMAKEILIPLTEDGFKALKMIGEGLLSDDKIFQALSENGMEVSKEGGHSYVNALLAFNLANCDYLAERAMDTFITTFAPNSRYYIICAEFMKDYYRKKYAKSIVIHMEVQ
ncbi:MAG: hypothetical protein RR620_08395 [Clostridium sp.]